MPAYTTSVGWLGYSDDEVRRRCREAVAHRWTHLKMKVGGRLEDDVQGLSEYVQHLSLIDYVVLGGALDDRRIEYVDELHEHFVAPVQMAHGRYVVPETPGYSIEMRPESLEEYGFPDGAVWAGSAAPQIKLLSTSHPARLAS